MLWQSTIAWPVVSSTANDGAKVGGGVRACVVGVWGGLLLAHRRHKGGDGQEDDGHATHHVLHEASRHEVRVPNVVVNLETELKGPEAGSV